MIKVISLFWLFGLLMGARAGQRSAVYTLQATNRYGVDIDFNIGTPPQTYTASLNTRVAHFIVMDKNCGKSRGAVECPAYCTDGELKSANYDKVERLRLIFCSPACEQLTRAGMWPRCGDGSILDVSNSSTFVQLKTDVTAAFADTWPFYGRLGKDRVAIGLAEAGKSLRRLRFSTRKFLDLGETLFVRGFAFDRSYMHSRTGLLDLAPEGPHGRPSLFPLLKSAGFFKSDQISVQNNLPPIFRSFGFPQPASVRIGALDKYSCRDWKMFPAYGRQSWLFEMKDVHFGGESFPGRHFGRIALEYEKTGIPDHIAEHFVQNRMLIPIPDTRTLQLNPFRIFQLHLEFSVGDYRIEIESINFRAMMFLREAESRYTDGDVWSFGSLFLRSYCFGYDYDRGMVGWADRRQIHRNYS